MYVHNNVNVTYIDSALDGDISWSELMGVATPGTKKGLMKAYLTAKQKAIASDMAALEKENQLELEVEETSFVIMKPSKKFKKNQTNIDTILPSPLVYRTAPLDHSATTHDASSGSRSSFPQGFANVEPLLDEKLHEMEKSADLELLDIINEGNVKKITSIRGIGLVRAKKIIDHCLENGPYPTLDNLRQIGISEKVLQNIRRVFQIGNCSFTFPGSFHAMRSSVPQQDEWMTCSTYSLQFSSCSFFSALSRCRSVLASASPRE